MTKPISMERVDAARTSLDRDSRQPVGLLAALSFVLTIQAFTVAPAVGQVVNDGTVGINGPGLVTNTPIVDSMGNIGTRFSLGEGDGDLVGGTSLFLSLLQLDLGRFDEAVLQGSPTIENLIARITGGASSIDGLIESEIAGADLFLINPDGIVFGENARLDVSGAVVISTAHEVLLGSSGRFDARAAGGDILTVDPPETFGFLSPPAPIVLAGSQLIGADEMGIALIGGDIELAGNPSRGRGGALAVRSGRIDLASLRSSGTVQIVGGMAGGEADLVLEAVSERGDITIRDDFVVTTSGLIGDPLREFPLPGSGPVLIRGGDLTLEEGAIQTLTLSDQAAGKVSIDLTGDLILRGRPGQLGSLINSGSDLEVEPPPTYPGGILEDLDNSDVPGFLVDLYFCGPDVCGITYKSGGRAGDIDVVARNVLLENGGRISSRSLAGGDAGTISFDLSGDLTIQGRAGDGDRSGITSNAAGSGNPGTILLRLPQGTFRMDDFGAIIIENGDGSLAGNTPGRIEIKAAALDLAGNARIDSSTRGEGPGGDILIEIAGNAQLRGADGGGEFTGITTLSQPDSTGTAGTITLSAHNLEIADGAQIAARPEGLDARGDAGSIRIDVENDLVLTEGTISTQSAVAKGGNIEISAGRIVDLVDSAITTSVIAGDASGGNIRIEPGPVAMRLERSEIVARAVFGAGGNIFIETDLLITDVNDVSEVISASSSFGQQGTEVIESPEDAINVHQPELPTPPIDTSALLNEPCIARDPGAASSLVFEPDPGPIVGDPEFVPTSVSDLLGDATGPSLFELVRRDSRCDF